MAEASHKRKTFIKNAVIPKVIIETGKAMSCTIGFMRVLIIPITIAATMAVPRLDSVNPGTR